MSYFNNLQYQDFNYIKNNKNEKNFTIKNKNGYDLILLHTWTTPQKIH